jgi:hypothetical protein
MKQTDRFVLVKVRVGKCQAQGGIFFALFIVVFVIGKFGEIINLHVE